EGADRSAIDLAPAGHDPVPGDATVRHPERVDAVRHEGVDLGERPRVEERLEPVSGGELAGRAMPFDAVGPAPLANLLLEDRPAVECFAQRLSSTRTSPAHIATRSVGVVSQSSP